jgi:hypothetical protein
VCVCVCVCVCCGWNVASAFVLLVNLCVVSVVTE